MILRAKIDSKMKNQLQKIKNKEYRSFFYGLFITRFDNFLQYFQAETKINIFIPIYSLFRLYYKIHEFFGQTTRPKDNAVNIISNKYHFIYVGVPLCGTRTILSLFIRDTDNDYGAYISRQKISALLKKYPSYSDYLIFSFVRNPFSRVVSCYNKKVLNANTLGKIHLCSKYKGLRPQMPFFEFVDWLSSAAGSNHYADKHWLSQSNFLLDEKGEMICDYIFHIENFNDDLRFLMKKLGIQLDNVPMLNTSKEQIVETPYKKYQDYYNRDDTKTKVAERYKQDIKILDYEF